MSKLNFKLNSQAELLSLYTYVRTDGLTKNNLSYRSFLTLVDAREIRANA